MLMSGTGFRRCRLPTGRVMSSVDRLPPIPSFTAEDAFENSEVYQSRRELICWPRIEAISDREENRKHAEFILDWLRRLRPSS